MNKTVVFLGILLSLLLLGPYVGVPLFGKPTVTLPSTHSSKLNSDGIRFDEHQNDRLNNSVKVDDLDLMDPVDPAEIANEQN